MIIALVVGVLLFRKSNNNNTTKKSTGTEWGDWYVKQLLLDTKEYKQNYEKKDGSTISVTKDEFANTKNCTIQMVQLENDEIPYMYVSFEKDGQKCIRRYKYRGNSIMGMKILPELYKVDEDKNQYVENQNDKSNYELQFLYNVETRSI